MVAPPWLPTLEGSPATNLSTVTIGTTDYAIPSGGGGATSITIQEDGTQEGTGIDTINISTNLDVAIVWDSGDYYC